MPLDSSAAEITPLVEAETNSTLSRLKQFFNFFIRGASSTNRQTMLDCHCRRPDKMFTDLRYSTKYSLKLTEEFGWRHGVVVSGVRQ